SDGRRDERTLIVGQHVEKAGPTLRSVDVSRRSVRFGALDRYVVGSLGEKTLQAGRLDVPIENQDPEPLLIKALGNAGERLRSPGPAIVRIEGINHCFTRSET